ncbi:MAG: PmoA family protein [Bacteroidales bacterium]|nr:PmoA family protein [Bacteroidales bacterium]
MSISYQVVAQSDVRFTVLAGDYARRDCPMSVDLSGLGLELQNKVPQLSLVDKKSETPVPCQLEAESSARLWFIVSGEMQKGAVRSYVLRLLDSVAVVPAGVRVSRNDEAVTLMLDGKPLLRYQYREVLPPEGIDPLFRRSGFIHPLWSPAGDVLTRIQAPDHYHHYGLWGPWTKTHINGREVDFWNLNSGQGTVRFADFLSMTEGCVYSGFSALQQHIDFGNKGADQIALNEMLNIRVWNLDGQIRLLDYTSILNCPLASGILLDAYRYGGGIGFRATEHWNRDNSITLTSEGLDRKQADGTRARWCVIEGELPGGRGGILFMSHPSNREFPEPMRVWPEDANQRGDVYFEFTPIRHKEWRLQRGKNYSQRYRLLLYNGKLSKEDAERYWSEFAYPPQVVFVTPAKLK